MRMKDEKVPKKAMEEYTKGGNQLEGPEEDGYMQWTGTQRGC
jgi:hypothetical protein